MLSEYMRRLVFMFFKITKNIFILISQSSLLLHYYIFVKDNKNVNSCINLIGVSLFIRKYVNIKCKNIKCKFSKQAFMSTFCIRYLFYHVQ